jgi:hypothetical protein
VPTDDDSPLQLVGLGANEQVQDLDALVERAFDTTADLVAEATCAVVVTEDFDPSGGLGREVEP